jgi:hypothetical protein
MKKEPLMTTYRPKLITVIKFTNYELPHSLALTILPRLNFYSRD